MTKTVTFIRHAEAKHNVWTQDMPLSELLNARLTDNGRKQSEFLNNSFDIVVLSPLRRAIETYSCSGIKCRQIIISDLFREFRDVQDEDKTAGSQYLENEKWHLETATEVSRRATNAIEFLRKLDGDNIGVITHACFVNHLLHKIMGRTFHFGNCQYITVGV